MRPHPRSKKRYWRDRNRVPWQYPRIEVQVFRRGEPMDISRFMRSPVLTHDHSTKLSAIIGKVKDLRADRRGVWTCLPHYTKRYLIAEEFKNFHKRGLVIAAISGYQKKKEFELVSISLIPQPAKFLRKFTTR